MSNAVFVLNKCLRSNGYDIAKRNLETRLLTDPGNAVISITNALDFFQVDHLAAYIPKDQLDELPPVFIGQVTNGKARSLALISKESSGIKVMLNEHTSTLLSKAEFLNEWTGLIIAVEKSTTSLFRRNAKYLNMALALSVLIGFLLYQVYSQSLSVSAVLYATLGLAGIVLSFLTAWQKLNAHESPFCKIGTKVDCKSVLNSEVGSFRGIDLSDLALTYFTFNTFSFILQPTSGIYFYLALLSLPVVVYSIYSQAFRLKTWCTLCLGICLILVGQFFLFQPLGFAHQFPIKDLIWPLISLMAFVIGWSKLKPLLLNQEALHQVTIENLSFKRNHQLFLSQFGEMRLISNELAQNSVIRFGASSPVITITLVMTPFCKACHEAYGVLRNLQNTHSEAMSVELVILIDPTTSADSPSLQVAQHWLALYALYAEDRFLQAMDDWHNQSNTADWLKQHECSPDPSHLAQLKAHTNWCLNAQILETPGILINGRLLSSTYRPSDLQYFIEPLITQRKQHLEKTKNIMHDKTEALDVYK